MAGLWEPVGGVFTAASASWLPSLSWVNSLGNSSFFTTVFGALAGAWLGAWAAQRIAGSNKLRDELRNELRSTNAGIMLSHTIANVTYALKKHHIKSLKELYDKDCMAFEEYKQERAAGRGEAAFKMAPNLDRLEEISPPIDALQEIVMGKVSTTGRAIASVTALADAVRNLNSALRGRNELIEKIKEDKLPPGARVEHFYFGIPYAEGKANLEYGCYVQALSLYTNDTIFFSMKLSDDLREHGLHVAQKYKRKFRDEAPGVSNFDWSKAEEEGLLPKDEDYESWLSGFQKPSPEPKSRWLRLPGWLKRTA
ncbi:hypothetical protein R6U79_12545 [Pseudomonas putida]|uniref:hypothetical protein n=1 Tax=Pseudomonas putida TaxID=303 RepID=UPI0029DE82F0|nr:hypothetical protein [Pseudomonas putida]WPK03033.1 hypothetical protein R6U79_12545 [Pseudomonas putida]